MSRDRLVAELVMMVTVLLMGSSYPFAKDVLAVMSPLLYSGSRYLIAGLFLFAMLAADAPADRAAAARLAADLLLSLVGVCAVPGLLGTRHGAHARPASARSS